MAFVALKLLGVEIPRTVRIGARFQLPHGAVGLVIHPSTVIGDDVKIYQGVTLGRGDQYLGRDEVMRLGDGGIDVEDHVIIGANAVVLFKAGKRLSLGKGAVIGANSTVVSSVPPGEIWVGSPAQRVGVRRVALSAE